MQASSCSLSISSTRGRDGSSTRQRSACGSRAESNSSSGPAMRGGRSACMKPSAPRWCGPRRAQNSPNQARCASSQAIGFRPGRSGTRHCSSLRSSTQARVMLRLLRSAVARAAPDRVRVSSMVGRSSCVLAGGMPTCPDAPVFPGTAARRHRLAGAGGRQQRQLAYRPALEAISVAAGLRGRRCRLAARRAGRRADRTACPQVGARHGRLS